MSINTVDIVCDSCGKEFTLTTSLIRNRQSGELIFRYMSCPSCATAYLISVTDKKYRQLLSKRGTDKRIIRQMSDELRQRHYERFTELFPTAYANKTKNHEA